MNKLVEEAKAIRQEYISGHVNRRINFRDGDATAEQIEQWEAEAAAWWTIHWPALTHLTDDGAGSGEPEVAAGEAGSNPAGNPAPSSPHLSEILAVIDGERGYMDNWAGRARNDALTDAREAVEKLFADRAATPAIDREALTELLRFNRHAPYVSNERLADMVTALIAGAS